MEERRETERFREEVWGPIERNAHAYSERIKMEEERKQEEFRTIVDFDGVDFKDLSEVVARASVLKTQPPLKIYDRFKGKSSQIKCRKITALGVRGRSTNYIVTDSGTVEDYQGERTLGSEFYTEQEVKELSQQNSRP